ncbi:TPA: hypothetical protein P5O18_003911, partial [Clostridioides difficile]|nr:hypothetical protein [Clostridioides difficile]HDO9765625.1 hypothetical protein [Clostridioides difficile]
IKSTLVIDIITVSKQECFYFDTVIISIEKCENILCGTDAIVSEG